MSLEPAQSLAFAAVILAAGRSSRMGRPKLLLPWGNNSIVGHLISQWQELRVRQLAIVCAAREAPLAAELDRLGVPAEDRILNPAPERGMFSSLQCAAGWSGWQPGLTHWAVLLGDQPHLWRQTLAQLLEFASSHPARVCQPARAGRPRHPVIMPKPVFFELARSGSATLKEFLLPHSPALMDSPDPSLDLDIDCPQDYERALRLCRPSASQVSRKFEEIGSVKPGSVDEPVQQRRFGGEHGKY